MAYEARSHGHNGRKKEEDIMRENKKEQAKIKKYMIVTKVAMLKKVICDQDNHFVFLHR